MVSHPSRRALAFGAAVSLGLACIAPSQAAFAGVKAPALPRGRAAVLSAVSGVNDKGRTFVDQRNAAF